MKTSQDYVAMCGHDILDASPDLSLLLETVAELQHPEDDVVVWQGSTVVAIVQGDGGVLLINAPVDRLPAA